MTIDFIKNGLSKIKTFLHVGLFEIFFLIYLIILYNGPAFFHIDGVYYLIQLKSLFEDGDLYLNNNLINLPFKIDIALNKWSIGPAIFWAPFYLLGHISFNIAIFIFPSFLNLYPQEYLIFGLDVALANIGTIFYSYFGLKILGKALNKYYSEKFSPIIVQISILLCTALIYYLIRDGLMSHSISFFVVCIIVYLWVIWHDILTKKQIFWIFFVLGIASLVRMQNVLYGVIFLPQIQKTIKQWGAENDFSKFFKLLLFNCLIAVLGLFISYLPQLFAWWVQYKEILPGWDIEDLNFFRPDFYDVWFGLGSGIFIWHPIMILFILGLFLFFTQKELSNLDSFALILGFILQSYVWAIYNPGSEYSFGHRGLIDSYPLLAFGFYNILLTIKRKYGEKKTYFIFATIISYLTIINLYLLALIISSYDPRSMLLAPLTIEWFLPLKWELILNTFFPKFPFEKIVVLFSIGFFVILTSCIINYLEEHSLKILIRLNIYFFH